MATEPNIIVSLLEGMNAVAGSGGFNSRGFSFPDSDVLGDAIYTLLYLVDSVALCGASLSAAPYEIRRAD